MSKFIDTINRTEALNNGASIDFSFQERVVASFVLQRTLINKNPMIDFLDMSQFSNQELGIIYDLCITAYRAGKRTSIPDLEAVIGVDVRGLLIGGESFSFEIAKGFAYDISEYSRYMQAKEVLKLALDNLGDYKGWAHFTDTATHLSKVMQELKFESKTDDVFTHNAALDAYVDELKKPKQQSVATGITQLDRVIGGIKGGCIYVIGGRTGMGKTAVAIHLGAAAAEGGYNVLNFSLEMMNRQNMARFVAREARKKGQNMSYSSIDNKVADMGKIEETVDEIKAMNLNFVHNYSAAMTVDDIMTFSERHSHNLTRDGKKLDVIIIDYLQIITMANKRDAHLEIGYVTGMIKRLAKILNVGIILLTQLNRSRENEKDTRPNLASIRQSGKIEEDADCILFPYRPNYYDNKDKPHWQDDYMEIEVVKNRGGATGRVRCRADMATNYLYDDFSLTCDLDGMTMLGREEASKGPKNGSKSGYGDI